MPDIFSIDQKDLKKLIRFAKNAPTHFRRSAAGVLNDMAFTTMKINKRQVRKTMTIRSKSFIKASFRVDMARTSSSISLQRAVTGSIFKKGSSGWREQETGKKTERKRIASLIARGGSKQGKIEPRVRLKKGNRFYTHRDFGGKYGKTKGQRTVKMIVSIRKGLVSKKPFIISSGLPGRLSRFKSGLYAIENKKIKIQQGFEPKNLQPRRNRWMTRSLGILRRSFNVQRSWKGQLNRNLPKRL